MDLTPVVGRWDKLRLEQVVTNLLSNAFKYGNGKPIVLSLTTDGDKACLSVTDHGIGIEPQRQERLFTRFERAVSRERYGGFGLGLWITRNIVEGMGGQIAVDSQLGEGSTFRIEFPCAVPSEAAQSLRDHCADKSQVANSAV